MESKAEKRGRGRPVMDPELRGQKAMVYLPPDVLEKLRSHPKGISRAIIELVRGEGSKG